LNLKNYVFKNINIMDPKYLKIATIDKDIYFHITDIKKYHQYSAHGIDFHNYHVIIAELHIYDERTKPFEEKYGGLFLYIDDNKKIRMYDNIKKEYFDIETNEDINELEYYYYDKKYCDSLENVVKDILLQFVIDNININININIC